MSGKEQLQRLAQDLETTAGMAQRAVIGGVQEDPVFVLKMCGLKMLEASETLRNVARMIEELEDDRK